MRVPTSAEHGSLNLAMAVTIALCECFECPAGKLDTQRGEPLTGNDREYLRLHVREVLAGLAKSESYRKDIEASVDRVFRRAPLETRDARAWHGILRAMGNRKTPADYGLAGSASAEERYAARKARRARGEGADAGVEAEGGGQGEGPAA